MIAAGLLARNAVAKGLHVEAVGEDLARAGHPGGRRISREGRTCRSRSTSSASTSSATAARPASAIPGRCAPEISATIAKHNLVAAAVLSGNRNFEGRVNPDVRANYLASPPLVVAYALAGSMQVDLTKEPLGTDKQGKPVYLADIWPSAGEVQEIIDSVIKAKMFKEKYANVFDGDANWQKVKVPAGPTYAWDIGSTYVQNPPYFEGMKMTPKPIEDIVDARILGLFLDSITTDHISPAGSIKAASPAGEYLHRASGAAGRLQPIRHAARQSRGDDARHLRQHPHQEPDGEGRRRQCRRRRLHHPSSLRRADVDLRRRDALPEESVPLVVFAGHEYGTGSSRDWAAKGTKLLGVRAVIAQSFERIHRSNLVGMGVLPLVFEEGTSWQTLGLKGDETVSIAGLVGRSEAAPDAGRARSRRRRARSAACR